MHHFRRLLDQKSGKRAEFYIEVVPLSNVDWIEGALLLCSEGSINHINLSLSNSKVADSADQNADLDERNQFFENEAQSPKSEPQPHSTNPLVNKSIENKNIVQLIGKLQIRSCVIKKGDGEMMKGIHIDDFVQDDEK